MATKSKKSTKIILGPGKEVDIRDVFIPDLWHLHTGLRDGNMTKKQQQSYANEVYVTWIWCMKMRDHIAGEKTYNPSNHPHPSRKT